MITAEELRKYIADDKSRASRLAIQAAYVKGKNPSILADYPKEEPDNRIPIAIARRAVNMVCGYAFKEGNIVYSGDGYDDALKETFDRNDEGLLDLELAQTALTHGEAYELHWTEGSQDQFAQVPISQCIAIYSEDLKPKITGFIRHWQGKDKKFYAHVYDDTTIARYVSDTGAVYSLEYEEYHGYGRVPVIHFYVAHDYSNLFDHVTELIDFYDRIISEDLANELSKFSQAIMLMVGQLDDTVGEDGLTQVDKIKSLKTLMGLSGEKSIFDQVGYLTKNINPEFIDSAADRCERLIYEMLQLFNPNDDTFVQASGVAQKYKLLGFEYLVTTIITYFSIGLQDRIALVKGIDSNLSAGNNDINTDVTITINRNLPDDLLQLAQIITQLAASGLLSDETMLKMFPATIVEDVDEELRRKKEKEDIFAEEQMALADDNTVDEPLNATNS
jgi:SPP1 family phage portal protein